MLKNLPIRLKLASLYLIITFFTIAIYVITLIWLNPVLTSQQTLAANYMPATGLTLELQSLLWQRNTYAQTALHKIEDTPQKEAALKQVAATQQEINAIRTKIANLLPPDDTESIALFSTANDSDAAAITMLDSFEKEIKNGNVKQAQLIAAEATQAVAAASNDLNSLANHMQDISSSLTGIGQRAVSSLIVFYIFYTVGYGFIIWVVGRILAKNIAFPLRELEQAAKDIATGNVDITIHHNTQDEVGKLAQQFRIMLEGIRQQATQLQQIASGDFTVSVKPRSEKDIVNNAIATMVKNNNRIMSDILQSSREVSAGSQQIAHGAQALAAGSSQQAASIDVFNSTLQNVQKQTEENAVAAEKTLEITQNFGEKMQQSVASMQLLQQAMVSIDESSKNITKMNKVIDDIAFQTNILALNAAVEAARAGQHGKGFAVVADEVRNLAAKSAAAAKETAELVEGTSQRVQEGNNIVEQTNANINHAGKLSKENLLLIQEIVDKSKYQSSAITELAAGIHEISLVVQSNSATAEQSAAASQEMSAQASLLNDIVENFTIAEPTTSIKPEKAPSAKHSPHTTPHILTDGLRYSENHTSTQQNDIPALNNDSVLF